MKILYVVNEALMGGIQRHVLCLMQSLRGVADTAVVFNVESDASVIRMFEDEGLRVYRLKGRSGHDWRIVWRFRRVLADFRPDVIHAHVLPVLVLFALRFGLKGRTPVINSLHMRPRRPSLAWWLIGLICHRVVDYWLPVSAATGDAFWRGNPKSKGEVFFNPIRLGLGGRCRCGAKGRDFIVGMVGRNVDEKDWPSFHKVESLVQARLSQLKSTNPLYDYTSNLHLSFLNAGEHLVCNGQKAIAKMDLFVMTSKSEELPTTMLECFALGTPICGFIPAGGVREMLDFSAGPVREAFVEGRDCGKLADLVVELLRDADRRRRIAEDGRRIVEEHFDAEKNCRGQLMDIYRKVTSSQIVSGRGVDVERCPSMICIAWGGMPAYAVGAIREFIRDCPCEVRLIATPSDVPRTCSDEIEGVRIDWVADHDRRSLAEVLGREPDVLFVSGWFIPSFNRFAAEVRAAGGKAIVGVDNRFVPGLRGFLWRIYFRLKVRSRFDAFLAVGASGLRLLRRGGVPERILGRGFYSADPERFTAGGPLGGRERKVIFVGRYDVRKNILPFARVFSVFRERHPEWTLECYGQGGLEGELRAFGEGVRVFPFLQPDELAAKYRAARVFVLPSLEDHWGVVVHEAALSGCALLLSREVGAAEDFPGALTFAPDDGRAMSEALERIADWDDVAWSAAEKASLDAARAISPRVFAEELTRLVTEVRRA